jgi:hypothetical protein
MDPIEDTLPTLASLPSPASAAGAPPFAPAAASLSGPKIFVLSPLPGTRYDVDQYFYSPADDVTEGDYAALLTFAAHYGHPLAIYQCPDIAAFQESHLSTIIHPFSEVPPHILQWGHELQSLFGAFSASQPGGLASAFLLSHSSPQGSSRGHDPPSIAAVTRASSTAVFPPLVTPILTGSTALLLSLGEWGERGVLALSVALSPPIGFTPHNLFSARVSLLPPRLSIIASFTSQVPFPRWFLRSSLAVTIVPHLLGGFDMLLHLLRTIIMRLHLWHLRLR